MKKKEIKLVARINKANNQINLNLKRTSIPKKLRDKLPNLKGIKISLEDFEW